MRLSRWIDVLESDWFFNEVMEASRLKTPEGGPFSRGIAYDAFSLPPVYEEYTGDGSKRSFSLQRAAVTPSVENPLYVYIDGVQTSYRNISTNAQGVTVVEMFAPPRAGALVIFASHGVPIVDRFGKPQLNSQGLYPSYLLSKAAGYHFDLFSRRFQEYFYVFGRALRRAHVAEQDWGTLSDQEVAAKYIGLDADTYCISPNGVVYAPFNVSNVTCSLTYAYNDGMVRQKTETFRPSSPAIIYTNRFFPNATITRAEAFVFLGRLKSMFFHRFSDSLPPATTKGMSDRFPDVGRDSFLTVQGADELVHVKGTTGNSWWASAVLALEDDVTADGRHVVFGLPITNVDYAGQIVVDDMYSPVQGGLAVVEYFMPMAPITRAEIATMLNRFRQWSIERLKL